MLKTDWAYSKRKPEDGLRVLVSRTYPRGVKRDQIDAWFRNLAPSHPTFATWKYGRQDAERWAHFSKQYLAEMNSSAPSNEELQLLVDHMRWPERGYLIPRPLEGRANYIPPNSNITLLCYEREIPDGYCHRFLLKQLIEERAHA